MKRSAGKQKCERESRAARKEREEFNERRSIEASITFE